MLPAARLLAGRRRLFALPLIDSEVRLFGWAGVVSSPSKRNSGQRVFNSRRVLVVQLFFFSPNLFLTKTLGSWTTRSDERSLEAFAIVSLPCGVFVALADCVIV